MNLKEIKQVIIVRKDLKMPKGKLGVQIAHASVEAVLNTKKKLIKKWKQQGMKKVCVYAKDIEELLRIYDEAIKLRITASIIRDAGKTVFNEPTITTVAIGPDYSDKIDKITKELKLV